MVEKEFMATLDNLASVMEFVESEMENLGCPMRVMMQTSVAIEELFVNIAHYAYEGDTGMMRLAIDRVDEGVMFRFTDYGVKFDPLSRKDPDVSLSAEERKIGGLGIYMVKQTMDELQYRYEDGQNILEIVKKF